MIAYKWLSPGRVSTFAGAPWPAPGHWLDGDPRVSACSAERLSRWIGAELWVVELAGDVRSQELKLTASRGRLVERVAAWDPAGFADECAAYAASLAAGDPGFAAGAASEAASARTATDPETAAVCAACAAHQAALAGGTDEAFVAAHASFSRWIAGASGA